MSRRLLPVLTHTFSIALTFVGLTAITFIIGRVMPADPVLAIVGDRASQDVYDAMFIKLGLDKPLIEQYLIYLSNIIEGDFGVSIMTTRPVIEDIARFFPATLELATVATFFGVLFGIPMGVLAAVRQGTLVDHIIWIIGLFGYSVPIFWLGLVALLIFYAGLGWLPGPGRIDIFLDGMAEPRSGLILLDQLNQEYILTARVKGLSETTVIWRHAFRNVLVQLITIVGLTYAALVEGSVLTETVFAWPGIGQYITTSLFNADMNAVIGGTVVVGICFVGINIFSDILYRLVDPRSSHDLVLPGFNGQFRKIRKSARSSSMAGVAVEADVTVSCRSGLRLTQSSNAQVANPC